MFRHATQIAAGYVAASRANRCGLGVLLDVAAARRTFVETANDALLLARLAARFVTFYVAALRAEFDRALGLGLIFAAVEVQRYTDKDRGHAH